MVVLVVVDAVVVVNLVVVVVVLGGGRPFRIKLSSFIVTHQAYVYVAMLCCFGGA